jgi:selenophosphate synthase
LATQVKLTSMAKAAGCAAKLNPATLDAVLRKLPRQTDPNVLVGFDTNDDAGIYKINEEMALVQTVDFFTPIVDDPYLFGQIAAANALSDVYAMGGRPISSLSIVGFPEKGDPAILEQIIRGGLAKMNEARCSVIGGHSIRNEDMLFGYAVTGLIHPRRVWRNVGAREGSSQQRIAGGRSRGDDNAERGGRGGAARSRCAVRECGKCSCRHRCHRLQLAGSRAGDGARRSNKRHRKRVV